MAAYIDPVTKRRVELTDDVVLGLLGNGNCSDLDLDENDEELLPPRIEDTILTPDDEQPSVAPISPQRGNIFNNEAFSHCNDQGASNNNQPRARAVQPRKRLWKKMGYVDKPHDFSGHPEPIQVRSPNEYFADYFDDNFYERLATCTNLYHLRKTGRVLNTTKQEMKKLIGIHLVMGILSYPRIAMYWRRNISIDMITAAMSRDRLMTLRNNLHIVDSDNPPAVDAINPLWKVQPVIDVVRDGCRKVLRVPGRYSVDEQMIPFTGKCHMRQLVKNKPRPVGLKKFIVTTSEGLMMDFEIYYGNNPALIHRLGLGPGVVLRLMMMKSVPRGSCIYFDRYFTTIPLLEELRRLGYHGTGTIMLNRIPDRNNLCLKEDKNMKRGDIDQRVSDPLVLVKWKDSKSVLTASNCTGGTAIEIVKRYEKKEKRYIDVDAPKIVTSYNSFMGGVDVLDQSVEYYRTFIKTRKWPLKVILHFMHLAMVNSWRLYKCDSLAKGVPKNRIQDLLTFRFEVSETLLNTPNRERCDIYSTVEQEVQSLSRYKPANNPAIGKRYDGYDHLPIFDDLKAPRTCRLESCTSRSKLRCRKCNVYLCMSRDKDCFYVYHKK